MVPATSESTIVRRIMKWLKSQPDCFCWKEHGGMYGTAGIPDIICCINGRFVAFEVKNEKGRTTVLQDVAIQKIQNAGGISAVVRSLDEVQTIVAAVKEMAHGKTDGSDESN